jgi:hypothetical protein
MASLCHNISTPFWAPLDKNIPLPGSVDAHLRIEEEHLYEIERWAQERRAEAVNER